MAAIRLISNSFHKTILKPNKPEKQQRTSEEQVKNKQVCTVLRRFFVMRPPFRIWPPI